MTSTVILIEGPDNTGKSMLIQRLCNVLDMLNNNYFHRYTYKVIHMHKPDDDVECEDINEYQKELYIKTVREIISYNSVYKYIILDRGWLSEYVYGQMYRNRSALEIMEQNLFLEHWLMDRFDGQVKIVMLTATPEFLMKHDDGKSLSENKRTQISRELNLFHDIYNKSIIKDKFSIAVHKSIDRYIDVLPDIWNFCIKNADNP